MKIILRISFFCILICSCNMSKYYANKRINHDDENGLVSKTESKPKIISDTILKFSMPLIDVEKLDEVSYKKMSVDNETADIQVAFHDTTSNIIEGEVKLKIAKNEIRNSNKILYKESKRAFVFGLAAFLLISFVLLGIFLWLDIMVLIDIMLFFAAIGATYCSIYGIINGVNSLKNLKESVANKDEKRLVWTGIILSIFTQVVIVVLIGVLIYELTHINWLFFI